MPALVAGILAVTSQCAEKEAVMFGSCSSFVSRRGVDGRDKRGHDAWKFSAR
jgi:hypothetical protein